MDHVADEVAVQKSGSSFRYEVDDLVRAASLQLQAAPCSNFFRVLPIPLILVVLQMLSARPSLVPVCLNPAVCPRSSPSALCCVRSWEQFRGALSEK